MDDPLALGAGVLDHPDPPEDQVEQQPLITEELIAYLDRKIPHLCIGQNEPLEHAHRRAGARDLVDHLIAVRAEQIERGGV